MWFETMILSFPDQNTVVQANFSCFWSWTWFEFVQLCTRFDSMFWQAFDYWILFSILHPFPELEKPLARKIFRLQKPLVPILMGSLSVEIAFASLAPFSTISVRVITLILSHLKRCAGRSSWRNSTLKSKYRIEYYPIVSFIYSATFTR